MLQPGRQAHWPTQFWITWTQCKDMLLKNRATSSVHADLYMYTDGNKHACDHVTKQMRATEYSNMLCYACKNIEYIPGRQAHWSYVYMCMYIRVFFATTPVARERSHKGSWHPIWPRTNILETSRLKQCYTANPRMHNYRHKMGSVLP